MTKTTNVISDEARSNDGSGVVDDTYILLDKIWIVKSIIFRCCPDSLLAPLAQGYCCRFRIDDCRRVSLFESKLPACDLK